MTGGRLEDAQDLRTGFARTGPGPTDGMVVRTARAVTTRLKVIDSRAPWIFSVYVTARRMERRRAAT